MSYLALSTQRSKKLKEPLYTIDMFLLHLYLIISYEIRVPQDLVSLGTIRTINPQGKMLHIKSRCQIEIQIVVMF